MTYSWQFVLKKGNKKITPAFADVTIDADNYYLVTMLYISA